MLRRRRAPWLLLLFVACSRHAHRSEQQVEGTIPIPDSVRGVAITLPEGQISFLPGARRELQFSGGILRAADSDAELQQLAALELQPRATGVADGWLRVEVPALPAGIAPERARIAAKLVVQLPPTLAVEATTRNGQLGAADWRAPVRLTSAHGKVYLARCEGDAVLRGSGAALIVDRHRGNLDAEGSEMLMQVFVEQLGDRGLRLVNTNGPIQAHVPAEASFELDLTAVAGAAANSFGIPPDRSEPGVVRMRGRVGAGGPRVHLQTIHRGAISLRGSRGQDDR
jgi:hypothetical protein